MPIPFATDPFASSLTSWGAPLFGVELALLGMVFLFDWVEGERLEEAWMTIEPPLAAVCGCLEPRSFRWVQRV